MNERSATRTGFVATAAVLMAVGAALLVPGAAAASPAAAPQPTMWVDCNAMSWFERLWSSYC